MRLASKELSLKLNILTGWQLTPTHFHYRDGIVVFGYVPGAIPAYDLDFILDKLVEKKTGLTLYHVHSTMTWEAFYAGKFFEYGVATQHWDYQDENPANAVALLAIDLIEKKIIEP